MFKIAICDDVPTVCSELSTTITDAKRELGLIEVGIEIFYSGEALIDDIKEGYSYDLIFLDIELGTVNGVEVGHIIRNEMEDYITKIIYISSKDTYDRQLFDVQPLHFLKKPLDRNKVIHDIKLAIKILEKENKMFSFKSSRNTIKIPYKNILYFEGCGREIILVSVDGKYTFYDSIHNLIKILPDFFIYPHRSYIVNYNLISFFKFDELIMVNGDIIPISRNKRKEIRDVQLIFEKRGTNV